MIFVDDVGEFEAVVKSISENFYFAFTFADAHIPAVHGSLVLHETS